MLTFDVPPLSAGVPDTGDFEITLGLVSYTIGDANVTGEFQITVVTDELATGDEHYDLHNADWISFLDDVPGEPSAGDVTF